MYKMAEGVLIMKELQLHEIAMLVLSKTEFNTKKQSNKDWLEKYFTIITMLLMH